MNKFVKEQLQKCRVVLPEYDDNTTHLIIPGANYNTANLINKTGQYNIEIKDYIIHEPSNFTLSGTWNNGTVPPEHLMTIKYVDKKGKMIKVSGIGKTTGVYWEGWLPQKGFEVL